MNRLLLVVATMFGLGIGCTESAYKQALYLEDQGKLAEAYEIYLAKAKSGHVRSQYHAGSMLVRGRGVKRNCDEGLTWLYKASDSGDKNASFAISVIANSRTQACSLNDEDLKKKYRQRAYDQGYPNNDGV